MRLAKAGSPLSISWKPVFPSPASKMMKNSLISGFATLFRYVE